MTERAFPVVFARRVLATVAFYEQLGFTQQFRLPSDGEPGYVGLNRGAAELAVVGAGWPIEQYGRKIGDGPRFEMFVYVRDVDEVVQQLRDRVTVLREPADMLWGERVAYITDPDGNPVAVASVPTPRSG